MGTTQMSNERKALEGGMGGTAEVLIHPDA